MQSVRFEDWQIWRQQGYTLLPAALILRATPPPDSWAGFADVPATALLESAQSGRYSFVCDRPARLLVGQADAAEIRSPDGALVIERRAGNPLDVIESIRTAFKTPVLADWPAMTGGLIGVFGYDLVHTWEELPLVATRDLDLPLFAFVEARELFVYDHRDRVLGIVVWREIGADPQQLRPIFAAACEQLHRALARWRSRAGRAVSEVPARGAAITIDPPPPSLAPAGFEAAVRRALDYIAEGHTYQVNLSLRTSRRTAAPPAQIYEALRRVNPSPYMGLLRLPEFALVCGSPELLVRSIDGVVSSRPIAGTRPRGDAALQDRNFSAELFASDKERAEHLMLVDLIRNDLGRVAEFGSVHVQEFMALECYSHVMHIVSQVEGRLAAGQTWPAVLRAMFPGGTITGCPKIRTMEIIEELEPVGRGFYTGALGWISFGGAMEMNIVIRSMLVQHGVAHVQAGAGIVADSKPERELDEARRKAQALWVALEQATMASDG